VKHWLTPAEIAALALPGLPNSDRGVRMLAEREDWARFAVLCRQRAGRGGGLEYHVNLLPVPARLAYFGAEAPAPVAGGEIQAAPEPRAATGKATLQLDARLAVLGALKAFTRSCEMKQTVAIGYFVDLYNLGKIELPNWAASVLPRLSTRSVLRWLSASREGDTDRLAVDRGAGRRGQGVLDAAFDGEIKHFAVAVHSFNELYSARQIHETVDQEFGSRLAEAGLQLPGLRAFEQRFKAWKQEYAAGLLKMMDPDGFRSKMRTSGSYAHMAPHLNALWQIDASPVDALCTDGRHSIYVCIDVWSRRLILFITRTPRSEAVQLLMRKAILAWGIADAVKTDNGSDFTARATVRLFAKLQIEPIRSAAFSPWQKGYVERHIRTFQADCATMLPGFVGHNVAQRKKIEGRKAFAARLGQQENEAFSVSMTGAELQQIVDQWAAGMYEQREHGGIGKMTPFARAASSRQQIRTVDPDALATLLMQAPKGDGYRTVTKSGIRVDDFFYLCPSVLPGDRVFPVMDPDDKGTVWLFADESRDRLLGRATNATVAGVDPAALLAETRETQRRTIDEQTAEIRKLTRKRVTQRTVLENRLARAAEQSGNLVAFPPRTEQHSTPALDAAVEVAALRRGEAPAASALSEAAAARHRELLEEAAAAVAPAKVTPLRQQETPRQRFRRALDIEVAIAAGDPVDTADAVWLGSYQTSAEYRAEKALREEFGEAALR